MSFIGDLLRGIPLTTGHAHGALPLQEAAGG